MVYQNRNKFIRCIILYMLYFIIFNLDFTSVLRKSPIISVFGFLDDCFTTNTGINYMMFSTPDKDNDRSSSTDCANKYQAGWWYRCCHCANPNGKYLAGNNTQFGVGITYRAWRGQLYSLKSIQFMVKPHYNYSTHVPEIIEMESETYLNI